MQAEGNVNDQVINSKLFAYTDVIIYPSFKSTPSFSDSQLYEHKIMVATRWFSHGWTSFQFKYEKYSINLNLIKMNYFWIYSKCEFNQINLLQQELCCRL